MDNKYKLKKSRVYLHTNYSPKCILDNHDFYGIIY